MQGVKFLQIIVKSVYKGLKICYYNKKYHGGHNIETKQNKRSESICRCSGNYNSCNVPVYNMVLFYQKFRTYNYGKQAAGAYTSHN